MAIVVVGPDGRGKDVLIAAARRRFAADHRIEFPMRVITRSGGSLDQHLCVSRRVFGEMETEGAFLVSWRVGKNAYAIPVSSRRTLERGGIVVFSATQDVALGLGNGGADVRIVTVNCGPDRLRGRLATNIPGLLQRPDLCGEAKMARPVTTACTSHIIDHAGNLAEAMRVFTTKLVALRNELTQECHAPTSGAGTRRCWRAPRRGALAG